MAQPLGPDPECVKNHKPKLKGCATYPTMGAPCMVKLEFSAIQQTLAVVFCTLTFQNLSSYIGPNLESEVPT